MIFFLPKGMEYYGSKKIYMRNEQAASIHPIIQHWQNTGHEIGMLVFATSEDAPNDFPYPVSSGLTPIGSLEAELLCVDNATGELLLLEHEVANRVCCRCAASQEHFIAAMRILEDHFQSCLENEEHAEDGANALAVIAHAIEAAGGSKYAPMYQSIVGY